RDRDLLLDAEVLLLQPRAARLVQHVEGDRLARFRRGIELHRDGDEPEGNRERCDGACSHTVSFSRIWRRNLLVCTNSTAASSGGEARNQNSSCSPSVSAVLRCRRAPAQEQENTR